MSATAMPLRPVGRTGIVLLAVGLALGLGGAVWAAGEGTGREEVQLTRPAADFLRWNAGRAGVQTLPGGTQMLALEEGAGDVPKPEDLVEIGYKGLLADGTVFDQSDKAPFPASGTIPGFSEALQRMRVGGRYRVWIPADQGYGERGSPPVIPPDSLLIFDVSLLSINNPELIRQLQLMQQLRALQGARGGEGAPPPR